MFSRTPFAWRNITHRKVRALVALSGVTFSVLLIFMQLGFYFGVLRAATAIYETMDGDIFLTSPAYVFLGRTGSLPRERLYQAAGIAGVRDAAGVYVDIELWRNPGNRLRNPMLLMGIEPARNPLRISALTFDAVKDGHILVDSLTRPYYGTTETGVETEIGDRRVRVAGQYRVGTGFAADGAAIVSDDTFVRIFKNRSIDQISVGVIRLTQGSDVEKTAAGIRNVLPKDTVTLTRAEMLEREEDYWANETSVGPVFTCGAILGLLIGIVIVYQVTVTDIAKRQREYATLKALGYDFRSLQWIVFQEVSIFSIAGFAAGALLSVVLYKVVRDATGMPLAMDAARLASIFSLTLAMCWSAGLLATRRLRHADPADLY